MVNENLLATYALLSFIRESFGENSSKSLVNVFVPLVREAISKKLEQNQGKEYQGHDYTEIKDLIKSIFEMEIPIPVLTTILPLVQAETDSGFQLFGDHSFIIKPWCKSDISKAYNEKKIEIQDLENNYAAFCKAQGVKCDFGELIDFIQDQQNRVFENANTKIDSQNYYVSKYVHDIIKRKNKYLDIVNSIYLGGLIGSYFKFHVNATIFDAELLIDTNFYISLANLNTEEAYDTCTQLYDMAVSMGFRFCILETTIEQIKILLSNRAERISSKDFISAVDEADILSACQRRGLNQSDLDSYRFNLSTDLSKKGVSTIYKKQIKDLVKKAEHSKSLRKLSDLRGSYESAFNDILADEYVQYKREHKAISDFCDVNCWFLNNSFTASRHELGLPIWQRKSITASDLLTLLWLANPSQLQMNKETSLATISLSSNVIKYRSNKLPDHQLIERIQDKVAKLQIQGTITQETIAKICVRMSEGCIDNNEAERLMTLTSSEFLAFVEKFDEREGVYLDEHERNNALRQDNKQLRDEVGALYLLKVRVFSVIYVIVIIALYVIYRYVLSSKSLTGECELYWLIDLLYWITTTVLINVLHHRYFINGLLSFFSAKHRQKIIDDYHSSRAPSRES